MHLRATCLAFALLLAAQAARAAPIDCAAAPQIAVDKIDARVIVVGEVHGTEQTPAFVGQLVCGLLKQGRPVILALERDGSEQEALNRYLASAGQPADAQALLSLRAWARPDSQDGRSSQAMLRLIEQVRQWRQAGQRVGVLAMQTSYHEIAPLDAKQKQVLTDAEQDRFSAINDRSMADNTWLTLTTHPGYTVVALAGNVHTAIGSKARAQFLSTPSFADVLSSYVAIHAIGLNGRGGSSWNMTSKGIGAGPMMAGPMFMDDGRIDSRVDLGEITASPPAALRR